MLWLFCSVNLHVMILIFLFCFQCMLWLFCSVSLHAMILIFLFCFQCILWLFCSVLLMCTGCIRDNPNPFSSVFSVCCDCSVLYCWCVQVVYMMILILSLLFSVYIVIVLFCIFTCDDPNLSLLFSVYVVIVLFCIADVYRLYMWWF